MRKPISSPSLWGATFIIILCLTSQAEAGNCKVIGKPKRPWVTIFDRIITDRVIRPRRHGIGQLWRGTTFDTYIRVKKGRRTWAKIKLEQNKSWWVIEVARNGHKLIKCK